MAKDNMQELTTERDVVIGTVPYQYRPTIRVNRETRVKAFGYYLRPRTIALVLATMVAGAIWLLRLLGRAR